MSWWGGLRGDLLRRGPSSCLLPTSQETVQVGQPQPGRGGSTVAVRLCSAPDNLGHPRLSLHCLQVRLTFPLEDILQARKQHPRCTRPSQPDSTLPHATLGLGTEVS